MSSVWTRRVRGAGRQAGRKGSKVRAGTIGRDGRTAMRKPFTGVGTALVTPFTRSGELDEAAVRRLGRRQIDAGIHFLCPGGTTGENPTLTDAERLRIVEIVVDEANGKVPVLA